MNMDDTWFSRELPVLKALVRIIERADLNGFPAVQNIAAEAHLEVRAVQRSLDALDGEYVDFQPTGQIGGFVKRITPAARRAVGQWPTAESLADRLIAAMEEVADKTDDSEKKGLLRRSATFLGGAGRDLFVDVAGRRDCPFNRAWLARAKPRPPCRRGPSSGATSSRRSSRQERAASERW